MSQVLIIGDRITLRSQVRLAVSAARFPGRISELHQSEIGLQDTRDALSQADVIFIAVDGSHTVVVETVLALRRLAPGRLVVVGRIEDKQELLSFLSAGADGFVDETAEIFEQVRLSVERFTASSQRSSGQSQGRLVTILGAVGGAGSTMVSANLAVLLAKELQSCGLIDLSGGYGELATLLELKPRHTLSDLCSNCEFLDNEMLRSAMTNHSSGVRLIASGPVLNGRQFAADDATCRVMNMSKESLPCVVADLDRRAPFSGRLVSMSDVVVVLTEATYSAAYATRCLLDSLDSLDFDLDRILLAANFCGRPGNLGLESMQAMCGRKINCSLQDDPMSANVANNSGVPAVLRPETGHLVGNLRELAAAVKDRLGGPIAQATERHHAPRPMAFLSKMVQRAAAALN